MHTPQVESETIVTINEVQSTLCRGLSSYKLCRLESCIVHKTPSTTTTTKELMHTQKHAVIPNISTN